MGILIFINNGMLKHIKLFEQFTNESLGVPENLVNSAKLIYDKIINQISYSGKAKYIMNRNYSLVDQFTVGDHTFNRINFRMSIRIDPRITQVTLAGANETSRSVTSPNLKRLRNVSDPTEVEMEFVFANDTVDFDAAEIKNYLIDKRHELIGTISHELKHAYDRVKKRVTSSVKRAEYTAHSGIGFGEIEPISDFFNHFYFVHEIENLVRASEVAGEMESIGITQKEFYNFITNNDLFKRLSKLRTYTYENLRKDLVPYLPVIKDILTNRIDPPKPIDGNTDDEIIDEILRIAYVYLATKRISNVSHLVEPDPMVMAFSYDVLKKFNEFMQKYVNSVKKYESDPTEFYEKEARNFRYISEKMIKKISKLYAMAKANESDSIFDREAWKKTMIIPLPKLLPTTIAYETKKEL